MNDIYIEHPFKAVYSKEQYLEIDMVMLLILSCISIGVFHFDFYFYGRYCMNCYNKEKEREKERKGELHHNNDCLGEEDEMFGNIYIYIE